MSRRIYYVYTLARPNEEVFYVGKGKAERIDAHESEARNGVESYKCNIIRRIWREGGEVLKTKVYEKLSEQEAFEREKTLIAKANLHRRTVARAEKGKPIERAKALVLAQTLSECVGKNLSIEDLGITIYSHSSL